MFAYLDDEMIERKLKMINDEENERYYDSESKFFCYVYFLNCRFFIET